MTYEREIDEDERREAIDFRRAMSRRRSCLCGYPDWPGQCPGPAFCPVHGEDLGPEDAA
ncbi:hypothetical protein ACFOGJ_09025 [Marinibaculum pumilum]|uniref:Uncharacterized protein n=1 Tax=Marinibaculum pumilum TaxID=1766165 RepID=A0ABV7KYY3_9PROT